MGSRIRIRIIFDPYVLMENFIELGKDKDSLQTGSSGTPQVVSANALPGPDIATAPVVVSQSATTQPAPTQTVSSVTTPAVASTVVTTGGATSTPAEVNGRIVKNEISIPFSE